MHRHGFGGFDRLGSGPFHIAIHRLHARRLMPYSVKELFYTLQGEGRQAGRRPFSADLPAAISGRAEKRTRDGRVPILRYRLPRSRRTGRGKVRDDVTIGCCDRRRLAQTVQRQEPAVRVFTGGEPLLQMDQALVDELHQIGFEIAIETNGTLECPEGIDWICVSPKAGTELILRKGEELKLVFPHQGAEPEQYAGLHFQFFFLQPMDGPDLAVNTRQAVEFCLAHPQWQISLQTHKILGIP